MNTVDFYKLQRALQDRFVGSVMSGFPPAPLLTLKAVRSTRAQWLAVSAGAFALLVLLTRAGYGSLDGSLSIHGVGVLIGYVGLVFALAFGLVQAWTRVVRERAHPFTAGIYLFPASLIDARTDSFVVYDIRECTTIEAVGSSVRVVVSGGVSFVFPVADPAAATAAVADVETHRARALQALASEDPKELVAVDPLHNPRFSSPVGPREPYEVRYPPWRAFGWAVALLAAVVVAPGLWLLRNTGSDKTMYARATKANDAAAYEAYLARGRAYGEQVSEFDLPRAELRDAVRSGNVATLVAYKTAHKTSHIEGEIDAAVHDAMLAELSKAKAVGTLAALDDFAKAYPGHGVDAELRAAKHGVYARARKAYEERAPSKNKLAASFVDKLFAWAEDHGSAVEVRFRRKKSVSLGRADKFVAKTPTFAGEVSYPTHYFDEKHAVEREERLAPVIAAKLDEGFAPELFHVTVGAPLGVEVETLPDVTVPTLFVTHAAEWSGHGYHSNRPQGSYVGIIYPFEATFVLPGDDKPFRFKTDVFRQAALSVLKEGDEPPPVGKAEELVYRTMGQDAFDQFGKKLLANFFAEGGK